MMTEPVLKFVFCSKAKSWSTYGFVHCSFVSDQFLIWWFTCLSTLEVTKKIQIPYSRYVAHSMDSVKFVLLQWMLRSAADCKYCLWQRKDLYRIIIFPLTLIIEKSWNATWLKFLKSDFRICSSPSTWEINLKTNYQLTLRVLLRSFPAMVWNLVYQSWATDLISFEEVRTKTSGPHTFCTHTKNDNWMKYLDDFRILPIPNAAIDP